MSSAHEPPLVAAHLVDRLLHVDLLPVQLVLALGAALADHPVLLEGDEAEAAVLAGGLVRRPLHGFNLVIFTRVRFYCTQ